MPETFGSLIKDWRGQRRMSQLDLALAADVSARHISFLETGRSRPSRTMVQTLAESLDIPRATRNALLNAAGFAQSYVARDLEDEDMAAVREAIDWTLTRHCPYPAIAFDRHWRLVRMNAVSEALLAAMDLKVGDSVIEAFLSGGPFVQALENAEEVARHMIVRLRTESAHLGGDATLDAAAAKMAGMVEASGLPEIDPMPAVIPARFRTGDVVLSLFSTIAQFGSTEDIALADTKIELMFPADAATRQALEAMFGEATPP